MAASRIVIDAGTIAHSYCRHVGGIVTIDIEEVQIQYFRYITHEYMGQNYSILKKVPRP